MADFPAHRSRSRESRRARTLVRATGADIGMAVDPDVDRLARGGRDAGARSGRTTPWRWRCARCWAGAAGRTRVATRTPVVVANLSTSLVVEDAARDGGARFVRAPVGEANVARAIRDEGALIGGEGNGGVILPGSPHRTGRPARGGVDLASSCGDGTRCPELSRRRPGTPIVKAKGPRGKELAPVYSALGRAFPTPRPMSGTGCGWHGGPLGSRAAVRDRTDRPVHRRSTHRPRTPSAGGGGSGTS